MIVRTFGAKVLSQKGNSPNLSLRFINTRCVLKKREIDHEKSAWSQPSYNTSVTAYHGT